MLFYNIFDLLTSRTQKIAWSPPVLKPDFSYLPIMSNSGKFKEISSTSFNCIIPPLYIYIYIYIYIYTHKIHMCVLIRKSLAKTSWQYESIYYYTKECALFAYIYFLEL